MSKMVKHRFTCGRGTRLQAQKNRRSGRFDGGKGIKNPAQWPGFTGLVLQSSNVEVCQKRNNGHSDGK